MTDSIVKNKLFSITDDKYVVNHFNENLNIIKYLFPFQAFPFYDSLNKRLDSNEISELLNVNNITYDSININSIRCVKSNKNAPFELSFSNEKKHLIEVYIQYAMKKKNKHGKYYNVKSNTFLEILYEINDNKITNLSTRVLIQ